MGKRTLLTLLAAFAFFGCSKPSFEVMVEPYRSMIPYPEWDGHHKQVTIRNTGKTCTNAAFDADLDSTLRFLKNAWESEIVVGPGAGTKGISDIPAGTTIQATIKMVNMPRTFYIYCEEGTFRFKMG